MPGSIVVLGHGACGAVKAAVEHIDANDTLPGSIRDLVELIRPAAAAVRGKPGDKLENAIKANVEMGVERLKGLDPILSRLVKTGELKVVGAVYELRSGPGQVARLIAGDARFADRHRQGRSPCRRRSRRQPARAGRFSRTHGSP